MSGANAPAVANLRAHDPFANDRLDREKGCPDVSKSTRNSATELIQPFRSTPTKDSLYRADPGSAELLKPWLEGKDLKRSRAEPRGLWVMYIPKNRVAIDNYSAIRDWLLPFKDKLEARATKQEWFELQQAQEAYAPALEQPKIIYGHFQDEPISSLEMAGMFSNNKTYFMLTNDRFLLTLLNSSVGWFHFTSRTTAVRGGFYEATAQNIETLPIPAATDAQKVELAALAQEAQTATEVGGVVS